VHYEKELCRKLLKIKGVYWNKSYKAFMIFRHALVKTKVEALLGMPGLLPDNVFVDDQSFPASTGALIMKPFPAAEKYMLVYLPNVSALIQQVKRLNGPSYQQNLKAYRIEATPKMVNAIISLANNLGIEVINELPKNYASKKNGSPLKSAQLTQVVENIMRQIPESVQTYMNAMVDYMLALNYSHNTIRNYANSFSVFMRDHGYRNPDLISKQEVVTYLGGLMKKGYASSTGSMMVNALLFYYKVVLMKEDYEINLPRPKAEKKLPVVLTMAECYSIFKCVENPKHKLLLLLAYGAGLRLSELIHLKWTDILLAEHKIHIKGAKGKKDRIVGLPMIAIEYLHHYRNVYHSEEWVFEGQYKGEAYSAKSVQVIMQRAIKKAGLEKRATVHTLRHSFATHSLEMGIDIRYIQQLLGHSSIMTTTIYTHLTQKAVDRIQSPLDQMAQRLVGKKDLE
jgi:site-specific recombinase XerD